jgi:hypothetical protein
MLNETASCPRTGIAAALARLPAAEAAFVHALVRRVAEEALRRGLLVGSSIMLAGLDASTVGTRVDLGALIEPLLLGLSPETWPLPTVSAHGSQECPHGRSPQTERAGGCAARLMAA